MDIDDPDAHWTCAPSDATLPRRDRQEEGGAAGRTASQTELALWLRALTGQLQGIDPNQLSDEEAEAIEALVQQLWCSRRLRGRGAGGQ